jgi:ribonuclease HI
MAWQRALFKGNQVWVQVSSAGVMIQHQGRVPLRYSLRPGVKIYKAGAQRVELDDTAAPVTIEEKEASSSGKGDEQLVASSHSSHLSSSPSSSTSRSSRSSEGYGKAGKRSKKQQAQAGEHARELIADLDPQTVIVYTDGACHGNPGPAGSAAVIDLPASADRKAERIEANRALGTATNNIAELEAISLALDILDEEQLAPQVPVAVLTDSTYCHGLLVKGWKAKANQQLVDGLRQRLAVQWLAGHVGTPGNERADQLANEAIAGTMVRRRVVR